MEKKFTFTTSITVSDEDAVYWMNRDRKEEYEKSPELKPVDYFNAAKKMKAIGKSHTVIIDELGNKVCP